jgi:hypothetical protein
MSPLLLALLDLLSLLSGVLAGIFLALAFGPNPGGDMDGEFFVTLKSLRLYRWGFVLLIVAFIAQTPRVLSELTRALCG